MELIIEMSLKIAAKDKDDSIKTQNRLLLYYFSRSRVMIERKAEKHK